MRAGSTPQVRLQIIEALYWMCRGTPTTLYALAFLLVVGGAAVVYLTPDDSTALISLQAIAAAIALAGGGAAFSGASLLSSLQK